MATLGRTHWAIAEGYIPSQSSFSDPALVSHETACILNAGDTPAHVRITIFFADRVRGPPGGVPVNVVVVSNRVARAKPDEPLAGGLAAALLPMVRDSGAIWVGSSGQNSSEASQARGSFARIEALGTGALATV